MKLRYYQTAAIEAVNRHLSEHGPGNEPCIVLPTAAGKTPVMAQICVDAVAAGRRVMVLAHRKELIRQTARRTESTMAALGGAASVGIYSAQLGRRDTADPVIVGQIQSVASRPSVFGRLDLLVVDEAHLIPPSGDGRYRSFIAAARAVNPSLRVIGLTATPYRTTSGQLCGPGQILSKIVYEIGIPELIEGGYLSRLVTKQASNDTDTSGLHIRAGEYKSNELREAMELPELVERSIGEAATLANGRRSCLVFGCTVNHCAMIAAELRKKCPGDDIEVITGDMPQGERDGLIAEFQRGAIRWLVNCEVLTTGFDSPNVDCVVLLRPTASAGLYYQMVGRGFRVDEGKNDCLVLDFGGNVERHGRLDLLRPEGKPARGRTCPECRTVAAPGDKVCAMCGYAFPSSGGCGGGKREIAHGTEAAAGEIVGGTKRGVYESDEWLKVLGVNYKRHRGASGGADSMMVEYYCACDNGTYKNVREWVCFEHQGKPRDIAGRWWRARSMTRAVPRAVEEALDLSYCLAIPSKIRVTRKEGVAFDRVQGVTFNDDGKPAIEPEPAICDTQPEPATTVIDGEASPDAFGRESMLGSHKDMAAVAAFFPNDRLAQAEESYRRWEASRAGLPDYGLSEY